MDPLSRRNRRWAVPAAAVAAIVGTSALVNLMPAHADTPNLPPLTPAELLAKARTAKVTTLSGTIELTSNLGLPSTSSLSGSIPGGSATTTLASLVAGTHDASVWMDGVDHIRLATAKPLAETNWVRNGNDLWSYDSTTLQATHATITGGPTSGATVADPPDPADTSAPEETPAAFAQQLLDEVTPSTVVTVATPTYIDDRPVYELVLSPKAAGSTIQEAVISVDGATGVPLAVRIDPKGSTTAAFSFGFSHVSFDKPDASIFAFTPPPGSTTVEAKSPAELINPPSGHNGRRHMRNPDAFDTPGTAAAGPSASAPAEAAAKQTTIGTDCTTVVIVAAGEAPSQLNTLFTGAPTIAVGATTGRLVTTKLVNAILMDDGRIAVGAVTPEALAAAAAGA